MAPTVWTARRKWLGNLLPALFWFPCLAAGLVVMAKQGDPLGLGLWLLIGGTVLGWLAVNRWGLFQNDRMKRQLELMLLAKNSMPAGSVFVGFSTPKFSSTLDPHEDVGFLSFNPDDVRFISETREISVPRTSVKSVHFRANIHSLLFLGRWIAVEGEMDGQPIRLLLEPRQHRTLFANRLESKRLLTKLVAWSKN